MPREKNAHRIVLELYAYQFSVPVAFSRPYGRAGFESNGSYVEIRRHLFWSKGMVGGLR